VATWTSGELRESGIVATGEVIQHLIRNW